MISPADYLGALIDAKADGDDATADAVGELAASAASADDAGLGGTPDPARAARMAKAQRAYVRARMAGGAAAEEEEPTGPQNVDPGVLADLFYGLYGDRALGAIRSLGKSDEEPVGEAWDEGSHPRGKGGKFITKGSAEAVGAAQDVVRRVLGGDASVEPSQVMEHLNILTVKQINQLAKEHGKTAPGLKRAELIDAVRQIMGQNAEAAGKNTYRYGSETVEVTPENVARHEARANGIAQGIGSSLYAHRTGTPQDVDGIRGRIAFLDDMNAAIKGAGGKPVNFDREAWGKALGGGASGSGPKMGAYIPPARGEQGGRMLPTAAPAAAKGQDAAPAPHALAAGKVRDLMARAGSPGTTRGDVEAALAGLGLEKMSGPDLHALARSVPGVRVRGKGRKALIEAIRRAPLEIQEMSIRGGG